VADTHHAFHKIGYHARHDRFPSAMPLVRPP
jgi:hypothetical protein